MTSRPLCILDAFVAERQKFHLLFLTDEKEPLKFRLLDDLLNAASAAGVRVIELHTYSFVCEISISHIRTPGELRAWYDDPHTKD